MIGAAIRRFLRRPDASSELGLTPVEAEALRLLRKRLPRETDVPDPDWIEEIEVFGIETERAKLILELARPGSCDSDSSS